MVPGRYDLKGSLIRRSAQPQKGRAGTVGSTTWLDTDFWQHIEYDQIQGRQPLCQALSARTRLEIQARVHNASQFLQAHSRADYSLLACVGYEQVPLLFFNISEHADGER